MPKTIATPVEIAATWSESFMASTSDWYLNGSRQASSEKDFQTKLNRPSGWLKL